MRLQKKLTIVICSALTVAAGAALGGSLLFANRMLEQSLSQQLEAQGLQAASIINSESRRALSLAEFAGAVPGAADALASRQREPLAALMVPIFQTLKNEGADQFQFHLAPAMSFLRVHDPKKFGDDLSGFRKTVVATNTDAKPVFGLEKGVAGVGIRGVTPVRKDGKHVGSVEVGLTFGKSFADNYTKLTGSKIAIWLDGKNQIEKYASTFPEAFAPTPEDMKAARERATTIPRVEFEGRPWAVSAKPLEDYSGNTIGVIIIAADRSALDAIWNDAIMAGGAVAVMMLLLGVAMAWWLQRDIGRPLLRMTETMSELASGRLDVQIDTQTKIDEIAAMARALKIFRDAGAENKRLEREATEQRAAADADREHFESARQRSEEEQTQVVSSIALALARLAQGDLTERLSQAFPSNYEALRADFNAAMDKLQEAIIGIATSTSEVSSASREISASTSDLSQRTEEQAASLEQTSASMEEISVTVKNNAQKAQHANTLTQQTRETADHSGQVVSEAVSAMTLIEESSRKISDIISVIDEIARQTNLLALNAAVEAARAGEAGRGFAVVASEVRTLAQRSSQAAKDIKDLITSSSGQVQHGVALVNRAGASLTDILVSIKQVAEIVADIANASSEQASGIDQINTALTQMDQATQQNSALVEQNAATAKALEEQSASMDRRVAAFRLDTSSETIGAGSRVAA
jgi:methyl-accepting chemotaxis protein